MRAESISVSINWSEGSSGEFLDKIVRPAEEIFRKVKGIKDVHARINHTNVRFRLELISDQDINEISRQITQELDDYRDRFPEEMDRPNVYFGSSEDTPVLWMFFSAGELSRAQFEKILKDHVLPELQKIEGVGRIENHMEDRGAVNIVMNADSVMAAKADMNKITGHIRSAAPQSVYIESPEQGRSQLVKVRSEDLNDGNIGSIAAGDVYQLDEISKIAKYDYKSQFRNLVSGKPGEFIQILPTADANAYSVSKNVYLRVVELCDEYQLEHQILVATHELLGAAYYELLNSAVVGGIGALMILLIFLRNIRLAFLVTLSLPVSLGTSIIAQNLMGQDISMMTLIGYILAVGIVVDNSIVIGEALVKRAGVSDFYRRTELIFSVLSDLALPITVSTLTTLAIFVPLYFIDMDSNLKMVMTSIGLPILWSLIGSLILALFILPMIFLYIFPKGIEDQSAVSWNLKIMGCYEKLMYFMFSHTSVSVLICLGLLITGPLLMYRKVNEDRKNVSMKADMRLLIFNIKVRKKLDPDGVENDLKVWSGMLEKHKEELGIKTVSFSYSQWSATAIISLNTFDDKNRLPEDIEKEIALILSPTENIAMSQHFNKDVSGKEDDERSNKKPYQRNSNTKIVGINHKTKEKNNRKEATEKESIKLMFMGQSDAELYHNWKKVVSLLEDLDGVDQIVDDDLEKGAVVLRIKKESRDFGISQTSLVEQLRFYGYNQTLLRLEDKWDVRVGRGRDDLIDLSSLMAIKIINAQGVQVPLEDLVYRSSAPFETELKRKNSMNYMEFSFVVDKTKVAAIKKELPEIAKRADLKWGMDMGYNLEHHQSERDMQSSLWILLSALLLIYFIMGILYESFLSPIAVLMTVPLTMLGVFCWLDYFEVPLSVMVILGLLFLLGIVVNNGIVLIDRLSKDMPMNKIKSNKECWDVLSKAASFRFMPVILTSLTTIAGGLAMVSGQSKILGMDVSELGMTMTIGMIGSTMFTLFVVPLIYLYLAQVTNFLRWFVKEKQAYLPYLFKLLKTT